MESVLPLFAKRPKSQLFFPAWSQFSQSLFHALKVSSSSRHGVSLVHFQSYTVTEVQSDITATQREENPVMLERSYPLLALRYSSLYR